MRPLTRAERRRLDKWCNKIIARLDGKALYHPETGEKVYRTEDIMEVLGLTPQEYELALAVTGCTDTIRAVDVREFTRTQ